MTIRIDGTNTAANPGITGTDTDTGLQFGTDEVNIVTGGTTAVTVDSSQRVGIGDTSPTQNLTVADIISVKSTPTGSSQIVFSDSDSDFAGRVFYNHTTNALQFFVNGSERARILSGGGLTFNGDTAAANALDDYEEGTWTPAAANYGGTLTVNSASYVKIGQLCFVHAYISFSSFSDSDEVLITGLPFTANSSGSVYYPIPTQTSTNIEDIFLRAQGALTTLRAVYQNGSSGDAKLTYSQVSGAFLIFGGCYRTT